MATFAAMVDNQDQSIGQLLDYLKSSKTAGQQANN